MLTIPSTSGIDLHCFHSATSHLRTRAAQGDRARMIRSCRVAACGHSTQAAYRRLRHPRCGRNNAISGLTPASPATTQNRQERSTARSTAPRYVMGGIPRYSVHAGLPLLSAGFRPFFLVSAVWACIGIPLWLAQYGGATQLQTVLPQSDWHSHEMTFGFAAATVAGFMLTAIPNWTGRMPLQGGPARTSRASVVRRTDRRAFLGRHRRTSRGGIGSAVSHGFPRRGRA